MGKIAWGFNITGGKRILTILFLENESAFLDRETFVSKESDPSFRTQWAWLKKLPGLEEVQPSELDPDSKWEVKKEEQL